MSPYVELPFRVIDVIVAPVFAPSANDIWSASLTSATSST